jgi:hypothetical protein
LPTSCEHWSVNSLSGSEHRFTYPPGFIDVDIGSWKELTGEDD